MFLSLKLHCCQGVCYFVYFLSFLFYSISFSLVDTCDCIKIICINAKPVFAHYFLYAQFRRNRQTKGSWKNGRTRRVIWPRRRSQYNYIVIRNAKRRWRRAKENVEQSRDYFKATIRAIWRKSIIQHRKRISFWTKFTEIIVNKNGSKIGMITILNLKLGCKLILSFLLLGISRCKACKSFYRYGTGGKRHFFAFETFLQWCSISSQQYATNCRLFWKIRIG